VTVGPVHTSSTTTTVVGKVPDDLPHTGSGDTALLLVVGAVMVVVGAGFAVRARRGVEASQPTTAARSSS